MTLKHQITVTLAILMTAIVTASGAMAFDLRDIARCSGVLVGQSIIDLNSEREADFEAGARLGFLAYFIEVNSSDYTDAEIEESRKIVDAAVKTFLSKVSSEGYSPELGTEMLRCTRSIALHSYGYLMPQDLEANDLLKAVNASVRAIRSGGEDAE